MRDLRRHGGPGFALHKGWGTISGKSLSLTVQCNKHHVLIVTRKASNGFFYLAVFSTGALIHITTLLGFLARLDTSRCRPVSRFRNAISIGSQSYRILFNQPFSRTQFVSVRIPHLIPRAVATRCGSNFMFVGYIFHQILPTISTFSAK